MLPELQALVSSGRATPLALLQCKPFDPIPDSDVEIGLWWFRAMAEHKICVENAAAARKLQEGD